MLCLILCVYYAVALMKYGYARVSTDDARREIAAMACQKHSMSAIDADPRDFFEIVEIARTGNSAADGRGGNLKRGSVVNPPRRHHNWNRFESFGIVL